MTTKVIKCTTCNIVICELLAFIQNKVDVMDEEGLVRLCVTAFSEEDIETSKNLLFSSVSTRHRKISRKKTGKSQRNIFDMISLFKQTDPEHVPIFVAKDLHKLPPVTFDHIDATRTLKEILTIQNEIRIMKDTFVTEKQLSEIRNELQNLKQTSIVNNFDMNINRRRGGGSGIDSFCFDSGPVGLPPVIEKMQVPTTNESDNSSPSAGEVHASPSPICVSGIACSLALVSEPKQCDENMTIVPERDRNARASSESQRPTGASDSEWCKQKTLAEILTPAENWKRYKVAEEWQTVQKKRSRNQLQGCEGKAIIKPDVKFRAAELEIPLFINRVDIATRPIDIIEYIQQKTNTTVTLKKINMAKQKRYAAYKIFVPHTKLAMFLNDNLWPEGIQFRKFIYFNRKTYDKNRGNRIIHNDMTLNDDGCTPQQQ
ncbi:uncharacterized protein LOC111354698 [Spodoptera litura]|uniref:Uncharacterized protein LOC111354596 n=1 Tax=Spodoptera litura TaxID=69820 RepID=A0A9J7IUN8_SPOLT|nr:uncharacterized protein LOC111354596 [Spodoptera litura]XP_022824002.1 uncharacterized protein LOC111354698 [Spodoptera litura]